MADDDRFDSTMVSSAYVDQLDRGARRAQTWADAVVFAGGDPDDPTGAELNDLQQLGLIAATFHLPGQHDQKRHAGGLPQVDLDADGWPVGLDRRGVLAAGWSPDDPDLKVIAQVAARYGFTKLKTEGWGGDYGVPTGQPDVMHVGNKDSVLDVEGFRERNAHMMMPEFADAPVVEYVIAHEAGHREAQLNGEDDGSAWDPTRPPPGYPKLRAALKSYIGTNPLMRSQMTDTPPRHLVDVPVTEQDIDDWNWRAIAAFKKIGSSSRATDSIHEFVAEWHAAFQFGRESDLMTAIAESQGWVRR